MKLYAYWRSSSSYRLRIVLNLKGLAYDVVPIHLRNREQHSAAHVARNPFAQVPALELTDEGGAPLLLTQSVAIQEYLEERFLEPPLLPADRVLRAKVRELVEVVNAGTQPHQNMRTLLRVEEVGGERLPWAKRANEEGLAAFARLAESVAGAYSVGDRPTFADAALVPQLYSARRFGIDVASAYPRLQALDERLQALDAVAAAHPDRQPDAHT